MNPAEFHYRNYLNDNSRTSSIITLDWDYISKQQLWARIFELISEDRRTTILVFESRRGYHVHLRLKKTVPDLIYRMRYWDDPYRVWLDSNRGEGQRGNLWTCKYGHRIRPVLIYNGISTLKHMGKPAIFVRFYASKLRINLIQWD